ncbi:hypothetical protein B296_00014905 [Ensete ventricosum]|uniref:Uncharacterized protein n=1 Tax=Ensete ventricosum TaxID=4639 RepID=A0A426YB52_ENSVE|nr:hypothetical protein B296_00014905 [Ensete ventricosum]
MRLWDFIAADGEEETRRVRHGATVAIVDDSGCNCEEEAEEAAAAVEEGLTTTEKEVAQKAGAAREQRRDLVPTAREGREMAGITDDGYDCRDEVGQRWREKKRQR